MIYKLDFSAKHQCPYNWEYVAKGFKINKSNQGEEICQTMLYVYMYVF